MILMCMLGSLIRNKKVKVNGKVYEVELESVTEAQGSIAVAPQAAPAAAAPAAAGDQEVKAPMAGTILDVKVAVGAQVKIKNTETITQITNQYLWFKNNFEEIERGESKLNILNCS